MGGPKRVLRRSEEGFKKVLRVRKIFKKSDEIGGVEIEVGRYAGGW